MFVAMVGFAPSAEANNASLVCCENENGTYHPVSTNGRAADYCVQTWDIPEGEAPGQYCDLGPQDLQCSDMPDLVTCHNQFGCYWGFPGPACYDLTCVSMDAAEREAYCAERDPSVCEENTCAEHAFQCVVGVDAGGQTTCSVHNLVPPPE